MDDRQQRQSTLRGGSLPLSGGSSGVEHLEREWAGMSPHSVGILPAMDIGMDNSVNKASISLLAMATLVIAAIYAKIRATAEAQAPEGYEDATGFHFGSPNFEE
jgi:hypothetical protein